MIELEAIKKTIDEHVELNDLSIELFNKIPTVTSGYNKTASKRDYPIISILTSNNLMLFNEYEYYFSVIVSIYHEGIDGNITYGYSACNDILNIIADNIVVNGIGIDGVVIDSARITNDLGLQHPFYEGEISFNFKRAK